MRGCAITVMGVMLAAVPAWSQELPPAELRRMYDDALVQLKAAQDRKNELANDNERLQSRIAELERRLEQAQAQRDTARRELADIAAATWRVRAHYAAWEAFAARHPQLRSRWEVFFNSPLLDPTSPTLPDRLGVEQPID